MRLLLPFLLLLVGCGYQFSGGRLPGDIKFLKIPLAVNQTAEPFLENVLAGPLTATLARQKGISLVESAEMADAILKAQITYYSVAPLSYDANDRISVLQATLVVGFKLIQRSDGRLLWHGNLQRQTTYTAAVDKNRQEDLESVAIDKMAKDLAADLLSRLVTRF